MIRATIENFVRVKEVKSVLYDPLGAQQFIEDTRNTANAEERPDEAGEFKCLQTLRYSFFDRIEMFGTTPEEFYLGQKDKFCRYVMAVNEKKFIDMYNAAVKFSNKKRLSWTLE